MTRTGVVNFVACMFALAVVAFMPASAMAQDCTMPNGMKGDIIFNNTHATFQGCTARGWMAFHQPPPPDPCTLSGSPGAACADGLTVYAGISGGNRLYTTKVNQSNSVAWKNSSGINDIATDSDGDGLSNSNQVPNSTVFPAFKLCKDLDATLGGTWYLPAINELQMLTGNGVAIGGFVNATYWSSTEASNSAARIEGFPSWGGVITNIKSDATPAVRCVRR